MSEIISIDSEILENPKNQKYIKGLRLRIYPTQEQVVQIEKTLGCCRQIYNERIQERNEFYVDYILPHKSENLTKEQRNEIWKKYFNPSTEKQMKEKFPYLKEVSDRALQSSRQNCEKAFSNFYSSLSGKRKGRKIGFPQFKKKKATKQSYQEICNLSHFDFNAKTIKIAKLGKVKFFERKLPKWWKIIEDIRTVTIERSASKRYYVSITCRLKHEFKNFEKLDQNNSLGLDFACKEGYVDSNNQNAFDFGFVKEKQGIIGYEKNGKPIYNSTARKLRKLQRQLNRRKLIQDPNSPKKIRSNNREKTRIKLARLEEKIANRRRNWRELETKRLATTYKEITVEDLSYRGMMKAARNAKNYTGISWSGFVSRLEQKGKFYGSEIIKANRYFPSSKLCSTCGWKFESLTLNIREWTCPKCGTFHYRDHNAAINLKNYKILVQHQKFTSMEIENNSKTLAEEALASTAVEEVESNFREELQITPKSL